VPSDDIDDSRVVEDVYVPFKLTSVVEDTLVYSSTPILNKVHVSSEGTSDVVDALMESSTPISHDIYVHEDDTNDSKHVLVDSSMLVQVARNSLATPIMEDEIEYETVATSVITFNKSSESPLADCQIYTYFSHEEEKASSSSELGYFS